jgi:hypothetical protein
LADTIQEKEMIDFIGFVDYVMDFYGPGGVYDFGAKKADVAIATCYVMNNSEIPFEGDSIDREHVRDVLLDKKYFNYEWRNAA